MRPIGQQGGDGSAQRGRSLISTMSLMLLCLVKENITEFAVFRFHQCNFFPGWKGAGEVDMERSMEKRLRRGDEVRCEEWTDSDEGEASDVCSAATDIKLVIDY